VTSPGTTTAMWILLVCRTPPRSDLLDSPLRKRSSVVSLLSKQEKVRKLERPFGQHRNGFLDLDSVHTIPCLGSMSPVPSEDRKMCVCDGTILAILGHRLEAAIASRAPARSQVGQGLPRILSAARALTCHGDHEEGRDADCEK
jgi:hypothetical protein